MMKKLFYVASSVMISAVCPAFGSEYCSEVPGLPIGTATYSNDGINLGFQAYSNNSTTESCSLLKGKGSPALGRTINNIYKCGGITLVEKITFRRCTTKERLGIPEDSGRVAEALAAINAYTCAKGRPMSDTTWTLKDRTGKTFELVRYEFMDSTKQTCTSQYKLDVSEKAFRVGLTERYLYLVNTERYNAKAVPQPSL